MKILVLDNYDSFTYNLVHYIEDVAENIQIDVFRNDEILLTEIAKYDQIILSPGPGLPADAGIMPELIKMYADSKRILGICLGHQAIAEAFGGKLKNHDTVYHGVKTKIKTIQRDYLFKDIPEYFDGGRYHSWFVDILPEDLIATSIDDIGTVMSLRHKQFDVRGIQFHPESILTSHGKELIKNWINKDESGI